MKLTIENTPVEHDAEIKTWFGAGGTADLLARPDSPEAIASLARAHQNIRVLGDGANILVDDDGIDGLVLSLDRMKTTLFLDDSIIRVGAGVNLPALIIETVRRGLGGLEGLGGIPSTVGGAIAMNAGGAWGEIADTVRSVRIVDNDHAERTIDRADIAFGYRQSGLRDVVITEADLQLTPGDPAALRQKLKEVMAYKKRTQPLADRSAGCAFKNPVVGGERISAGGLIDLSGCKGLRNGTAYVSDKHANFVLIDPGGKARDAIELMDIVIERVKQAQGITLEHEIAVWRRGQ